MNKTIFITGASSGLGKATAKLFASKGWTVIGTMRNPQKETELSQLPNVYLLKLDICNVEQITDVISKAEQISPIDVLFNNAGYALGGDLEAIRNIKGLMLAGQKHEHLTEIATLIEEGKVKVLVSKVYSLEQVVEAHKESVTWHVRGKLVLEVKK